MGNRYVWLEVAPLMTEGTLLGFSFTPLPFVKGIDEGLIKRS
jgi:hypothetical protein